MKLRFAIAGLFLLLVETACPSFCPPQSAERGKKGDEQWCEVKNPEGLFVKSGPYKLWHSNGKVSQEGQYLAGRPTGHWIAYDETGERQWENTFDEKGDPVGVGKYFSKGRDLVAEPDLATPKSSALSFVVAMNLGDDAAVQRVLGGDYASAAASDCKLKKELLHIGNESCDADEIRSKVRRLHDFTRKSHLKMGDVHEASSTEATIDVTVNTRNGEATDTVYLYKRDVVWRPAQIPPEMLLPSAFKAMVVKEVLDGNR